jgi:hypothetical protein
MSYQDQFPEEFGRTPQIVGNDKYSQIMELMRRRNAMNNSTYTGGFNPYAVAPPPRPYSDLIARQGSANEEMVGGRGDIGPTNDGYGKNSSPMSNSINGSFGYQAIDAYGRSGLPGSSLASDIAQSMNPAQVAAAGVQSAQALQDAIAGYTSGTMFGAPPSDPSTFGGGGYGTPVADGGYGVTGVTGAGVAANPMSIDPATAQGQQAAASQAASNQSIADAAEAEGFGLGPAATGDVGGISVADAAEAEGVALGPAATGDVGGGGGGEGGGGCFLTTAAVSHMKQKDNGKVLNTLREFRDTYMRKNKEKSKDVAWYYENAPRIVAALDKRPDADKVYKKMYSDFIKPAYDAIQEGDEEYAYEIYKDGIDFAKKHSGISKKEIAPRYGPNSVADSGVSSLADGGMGDSGGGLLFRSPSDGKYGIELMNAINAGKISKGKLRGLLEA